MIVPYAVMIGFRIKAMYLKTVDKLIFSSSCASAAYSSVSGKGEASIIRRQPPNATNNCTNLWLGIFSESMIPANTTVTSGAKLFTTATMVRVKNLIELKLM